MCPISGKEISPERVIALQEMGVPRSDWTHASVAPLLHRPRRAVIVDEDGGFMMCDRVGEPLDPLTGDTDEVPEEGEATSDLAKAGKEGM